MLDTYDSYPSWRKFQPYFPEDWRINEQNAPEEYYWKWRDFDVHIDRISHSVSAINQTWTWSLRTSSGSEVGAWVLGSSRLGESTNLAW